MNIQRSSFTQPDNGFGKLCEECGCQPTCRWSDPKRKIARYSSPKRSNPFIETCHSYEPRTMDSTPTPAIHALIRFVEKEPISGSDTFMILEDWISTRYADRIVVHKPGMILLVWWPKRVLRYRTPVCTFVLEERETPHIKVLTRVTLFDRISKKTINAPNPIACTVDLHGPDSFIKLDEALDTARIIEAVALFEGAGVVIGGR